MRKPILALAVLLVSFGALAEEVTLPAAASIQGPEAVAPFFSDVRVFNTSYTSALDVTASYHCFIPANCTAGQPSMNFTLQPRESRAFDDMVAQTFQAANTAGGIEFEFSGASEHLVVTSRLFSTAPQPTVGMFIPGLDNGEAYPRTVLTSIRNGGPNQGFRSNVGVYNREDAAVTVTFTIFDAGTQVGSPVVRDVAGHSGVQLNQIFNAAGDANHATENAVVLVSSTGAVFSYAAVIDNNTTDPIFVRGAEDVAPVGGGSATHTVGVGEGGLAFGDDASHTSVTQIHVGDAVKWVWNGSTMHGVTSGDCTSGGGGGPYLRKGAYPGECNGDGSFASGSHNGSFEFSHTFTAAGSFTYFCPV